MAEVMVITDATLDGVLRDKKPALILLSNGEGLRSDFSTAFKSAVNDYPAITFAKIDPTANPQAARQFDVGSKPVMVGWYNGAEILRRPRPWGTDVPLAVEMLQKVAQEQAPVEQEIMETPVDNQPVVVDDKPVIVTDATFEAEVLNYDKPVLVDFWAEWCGPCRALSPKLEEIASEMGGKVQVVKINVDENEDTPRKYGIRGIPAMLLFKGGQEVGQLVGNHPKDSIVDFLNKNI